MYAVAARLDPDSYHALATAVYAEMALAGITCVGEFHYLHHGPGGAPYADPNAMGEALVAAAAEAGIRITLLDTCYLTGGIGAAAGRPAAAVRRRRRRTRWAAACRRAARGAAGRRTPGSARRSTRSAPCRADQLRTGRGVGRRPRRAAARPPVRAAGRERGLPGGLRPDARPRCSPSAGALGPAHRRRARHAPDRRTTSRCSAAAGPASACARPPSATWPTASARPATWPTPGSALSLGSDQHAVIDLFEEARASSSTSGCAPGGAAT